MQNSAVAQGELFEAPIASAQYLNIKDAAIWATNYLNKNVTAANISYLIQYGKVKKYGAGGEARILKNDLARYYNSFKGRREIEWKGKLGGDLNWALSFDNLKEAETTKHVHRLHPYKGKFIPQLVEYFLDAHTDAFKTETYFNKGDTVLDPFCGSGTTLVEANELGMNAIGIDVSAFNALVANSKTARYDLSDVQNEIAKITSVLRGFVAQSKTREFEERLAEKLSAFNNRHFPVPEFKYKVQHKEIDGDAYGAEKAAEFLPVYKNLVKEYGIALAQKNQATFLDKWLVKPVRDEIDCVYAEINKVENESTKRILCVILSRTVRSCRATTHADLGTLKEPVTQTYYCAKHGKVCKPLFSILKWWETYCKDTLKRLQQFDALRTDSFQYCVTGDSRTIDIFSEVEKQNAEFGKTLRAKKIDGIFSSPPYVGLIDYHEQHAYAYDLFGFARNDELEIGPLFKGQGLAAQQSYVEGVAGVLNNCQKYLADGCNIFLVANDKYDLYPKIAEAAGLTIINRFKRPVLNRTERDKGAYAEIIFHLKRK